jgi:hypothetical protein
VALAAVGIGVALGHGVWTSSASSRHSNGGFVVLSSYRSPAPAAEGRIWFRTGASADAPQWGAVLFCQSYELFSGTGKHSGEAELRARGGHCATPRRRR